MSIDHHSGKGYAPLPQGISNTDTEDEEECLAQPNDILNSREHETTIAEQSTIHENGVYYPLDETRNLANRTRNGQNTLKYYRDDIPIMIIEGNDQNDMWKHRNMSPIRQFCLVASILLCIATILIFLYILPCDNSMVCPPVVEPQSSISWDKTLQGMELHGPISIIPGSPHNLIFLLRGQHYRGNNTNHNDPQQIPPEGGGVMSMEGNRGLPLWMVPFKRLPTELDCLSLDTDHSGKPNCIVVGDHGLLVSIEPIAGIFNWNSEYYTFPKLPVILPDVDSDGVEDLLTIDIKLPHVPALLLLSGKTGRSLGRYSPGNCTINIYNLVLNNSITYVCHEPNQKSIVRSMSFKGLLHTVKLLQVYKRINGKPRLFETQQLKEEKSNYALTAYHHLQIENEGTCPGVSCRANVNLTLQSGTSQAVPIWDHVSSNAMASKPAFLFVSKEPYTSGFAIKFWQWIEPVSNHTKKVSGITEHKLIERVLIVFVNYTDVHVMNASQTDITQLCLGHDCQPNLNSRLSFSSITVVNTSDSGLPELISYWSSYDIESRRILTSKVQVVKLDSILSNLPRANM